MKLILSLFSGIGLLDKAFKDEGYCVVSAGDIILGAHHNICDFAAPLNKFDGIIGGSPCQDFSKANRDRPGLNNSYGLKMLNEFKRVVQEAQPTWWLLENVPTVPNITIDGYSYQRIDINQSWYEDVNRLRHIQFGHKENKYIQISRGVTDPGQIVTVTDRTKKESCDRSYRKIKSCALASDDRPFKELVKLQGLDEDFDIPSFNVQGKKRAVGNGVPLSIGRVLAKAVTVLYKNSVTLQRVKYCKCDCKRIITHKGQFYDFSCRKRYQRLKDKN